MKHPILIACRIASVFALSVLCSCHRAASHKPAHPALQSLPAKMLWAWERREDLRWLPADAGVAYVASSVILAGSRITVMPRANALHVRDDTPLVPVVHVDASWREPPLLDAAQRTAVVDQVLAVARRARPGAPQVVQLDFEVRRSQRAFLGDVVRDIRAQLPPGTALSVTALASWCAGDYWLSSIHADELVPMAFRMGRDEERLRRQLAQDDGFRHARCRSAIGFATDEPILPTASGRRYFFSPTAWTPGAWQRMGTAASPPSP